MTSLFFTPVLHDYRMNLLFQIGNAQMVICHAHRQLLMFVVMVYIRIRGQLHADGHLWIYYIEFHL